MKKILISGYHGFGNCGDEAILVSMVKNLRHVYPDLKIVTLSKNPIETQKLYSIDAIGRINLFSIIGHILGSNIVLSGGGSLLQDVTSTRSLIYYLSIISMAKILGKPVMVYANGIGPIRKPFNRFMTKFILNRVNVITLRDQDSKKYIDELGVKKPDITVTADPVFTLDDASVESIDEAIRNEGVPLNKPLIGISIREWKTNSDYINVISEAADKLVEKYNCNILFIPMQMPKDMDIIQKTRRLMKHESYTLTGKYAVQTYMGIIGRLQALISMRLHTLIFATVQKTPMVGINYDPKVESFLKLVNQPSAGKVTELEVSKIIELVENCIDNKENVIKSLGDTLIELREKAHINDEKVIKLLQNN